MIGKIESPDSEKRNRIVFAIQILNVVLIAIICVYIGYVLSTGRYYFSLGQFSLGFSRLSSALILFCSCLIVRKVLQQKTFHFSALSGKMDVLFFALVIVYLANGKTIYSTDTVPAHYLPFSILLQGSFYLDNVHTKFPSIVVFNGHSVSMYPVASALFALPFYALSVFGGLDPSSSLVYELEKISAVVTVALSALFLYATLLRLTTQKFSLLLLIIYALGTSSLSISSQALWQHGASQLCLAAAIYCLIRGRVDLSFIPWAGLALSMSAVCRPTQIVFASCLGAYVLFRYPKQFPKFVLFALPPILFQIWYNISYFGHPFHTQFSAVDSWTTPFQVGFLGILFSPARGLFIYSPVFIFSILGMVLAWMRPERDPFFRFLSMAVVILVFLYSKWVTWWGGGSYGPRMLGDLTPALVLLICPAYSWITQQRVVKSIFVVLIVLSIWAHVNGAFFYNWRWSEVVHVDEFPETCWAWADNPLFNGTVDCIRRVVMQIERLPNSLSSPQELSANYSAQSVKSCATCKIKSMQVFVYATNNGKAIWRSASEPIKGIVTLHWVLQDQRFNVINSGRLLLYRDVFPSETQFFHVLVPYPERPGRYRISFGLFSEKVTPFFRVGVPPVQLRIQIKRKDLIS